MIGQLLCPKERVASKPISNYILKKFHIYTPKLTKKYTEKLSILLNSNEIDYKDKRKRINKLIIQYNNDYKVKLTDPIIPEKERCTSQDSRNNQNNILINLSSGNQTKSHCSLKQIINYQSNTNKKHLNIPEFYDKETIQVKQKVKKELDDYYQLNINDNDKNDYHDNCTLTKEDMLLFYSKLNQQHQLSHRINLLLSKSSISNKPNLSEVSRIFQRNTMLNEFDHPKPIINSSKVLFDNNYYNQQCYQEKYKSLSPSNSLRSTLSKKIVCSFNQSNKEILNIVNKENENKDSSFNNKQKKKLAFSLPKQEVLDSMNKQNEVLSALADKCKQLFVKKQIKKLRSTNTIGTKRNRNDRSMSTHLKKETSKLSLSPIN